MRIRFGHCTRNLKKFSTESKFALGAIKEFLDSFSVVDSFLFWVKGLRERKREKEVKVMENRVFRGYIRSKSIGLGLYVRGRQEMAAGAKSECVKGSRKKISEGDTEQGEKGVGDEEEEGAEK